MVEVGHRNGSHVIRVIRDVPTVNQLLTFCRLESEAQKEMVIPNITFIKAPLNSTLQGELGWKVQSDNSILIEKFSEQLLKYANLVERDESVPKLHDYLHLKTEHSNILSFASAPRLTTESLQLSGILAGLSSPVYKELLNDEHQVRQELHLLIKSFESATSTLQLLDSVQRINIPSRSEPIHTVLKEVKNIRGFVDKTFLSSILPVVVATMKRAKVLRVKIREAASRYIKPTAVQFALRGGKIFISTPFDPEAMTRAETLALPFAGNSLQGHRSFPDRGSTSTYKKGFNQQTKEGEGEAFRGSSGQQKGFNGKFKTKTFNSSSRPYTHHNRQNSDKRPNRHTNNQSNQNSRGKRNFNSNPNSSRHRPNSSRSPQ